jgi:putative flavoprotein involved in K+ transport
VVDCVVVGAGQAGLASSYHLSRLGIEHVVLERSRVAQTWRVARWDGFHLNTPNWATQLPGLWASDADPDAFAPLVEVIAMLENYASQIDAPVQNGAEVTALRRAERGFELNVDGDSVRARAVVVATGAFQQPTAAHAGVPSAVLQLHSAGYRRASDLPAGGVLVVGSGQSGCEIAQELLEAGRSVHLSVGRCPWAPRRHRGRELIRWLVDVGMMDDSVDALPSPAARLAGNVTVSGAHGGVDCNPLLLEEAGARLHGRSTGFRDGRALFADDLSENLERGLRFERELRRRFDDYARAADLDLPPHVPAEWEPQGPRVSSELALDAEGIAVVLWANGFRPAFGWIEIPVFDELGFPRARRGVTDVPGLVFVGLPWLHTRRSPLLLGVGDDAGYVSEAVAAAL